MKLVTLLVSFVFAVASAPAQIQIGSAETPVLNSAGSLDADDLATFKKTTTVFYIQEADASRKADFEAALRGVWTITPFLVATPDEMDRYGDGRSYSQAGFGGYVIQRTSRSGMTTTHTHLSYDFGIAAYNKRGEEDGRTLLARFLLSPDAQTLAQSNRYIPTGRRARNKQETAMMHTLYSTAQFTNWGPGYLRSYAKVINDALLSRERRGIFSSTHADGLAAVANDTLFLPLSLKNRYSALTGMETEAENEDDEKGDMLTAYPFKAQFVSDKELQQRILSATKPTYYLVYVRSSTDKHVAVFNGQSGELLYADYTGLSYNFKAKDLKKVGKAISN